MKYIFLIFIGLLISYSCTYNSEEELGVFIPGDAIPIDSLISFQITIRPIIDADCAISGCHVSSSRNRVDLSIDQEVVENAQDIKSRILSSNMPRGRELPFDERSYLVAWVNQGALLD
ncbi:MAG: hypothetical protein JXR07_13415 [Reichenbachiella sp.]